MRDAAEPPASTRVPWEVLYEDATLRVWAQRALVGVAWFEVPNVAQMVELGRLAKARGRAHPPGVGLLQLVVRGTPRFTDEVRAEVERITRDDVFSRGGAHVILAPGMAGAAARAFLSTVLLLRRDRRPAKVFSDPEQAAVWLAETLGAPWQPAEIARMARALIASGEGAPTTSAVG